MRARALACLARREYARVELARKLAPHAVDEGELHRVLDELESDGYLSTARFVDALVRRRGERYGVRRVAWELDQRGVEAADQALALQGLRHTEAERAWQAWERRFGQAPASPLERARQHRFLLARGFSADAINTVFRRLREASSPA